MNNLFIKIILIFCCIFFVSIEAHGTKEAFNEGITQAEHYVTVKGDQLRYAYFKTPLESKGAIVFVQGRGTFLEFYETVIVSLLERGLDVWMYDLSGQGGSSRLVHNGHHDQETVRYMQHVDTFDQYIDDLNDFIENIVVPNARSKLFLGGYSTGGLVALRYLQTKNASHPFAAAFMISPLLVLKVPLSNVLSSLLWSASWIIDLESYVSGAGNVDPIFTMPFTGNPYTGDVAGFIQLKELCVLNRSLMMGGVSYGWVKTTLDSLSILWSTKAIKSIQVPILIASGGKDGVVDVSYNVEFVNKLAFGHHLYFQEGRHELFRETEEIKILLWNELDEFLFQRS
jgi:lysophospholipase